MKMVRNMLNRAARAAGVVAAAGALMVSTVASLADVVVLKDGRRLEGRIIREIEGSVFIILNTGINAERFIAASEIKEIIRDAGEEAQVNEDPVDPEAAKENETPWRAGVPRGLVITLEGTVGTNMTAENLRNLIPIIESEIGEGGIVVFKVNSGGGMLAEVEPLSDVIELEYKTKFQVVAWIESAISAAAMTAHNLEDIYFMPEGNYGAATAFSGALEAVKDFEYLEIVRMAEELSRRGGWDKDIMRAMQGDPDGTTPLSVSRDPDTGEIEWTLDESGRDGGENAALLNPAGEVFTFNSVQAEYWGFSRGTVATLDELTRAMGYQEIDWVGDEVRGLVHPVSKAERENRKWREAQGTDGTRFDNALAKFQLYFDALGGGRGGGNEVTAKIAGRAREALREIRLVVRNNPTFGLMIVGTRDWDDFNEWYRDQEDAIRRAAR
ncbi:MAG: hypothetical protein AAGI17_09320 [Planctomycetota bacterium]